MNNRNTIPSYLNKFFIIILVFINVNILNAQKVIPKEKTAKPIIPAEVKKSSNQSVSKQQPEETNNIESKSSQIISPKFLPVLFVQKFNEIYNSEYKTKLIYMNEYYAFDYNKNSLEMQKKIIQENGEILIDEQVFYNYFLPKIERLEKEEETKNNYFETLYLFLSNHEEVLNYAPAEIVNFYNNIKIKDFESVQPIYQKQLKYNNIIKID